jgi:hypothetical protein
MDSASAVKPSKLDLYAINKSEYVRPRSPEIVKVKPAVYLAIDGEGEPGGPEFQTCIRALYNVAYTTKMASKAAGQDYTVTKLEGFWDPARDRNHWTLTLRVPPFTKAGDISAAGEKLARRKLEGVDRVRLMPLKEGTCVQMLHVGPYCDEPRTLAVMRAFMKEQGLEPNGLHHEIYFSDPRRVAPEKLQTLLRQPVR